VGGRGVVVQLYSFTTLVLEKDCGQNHTSVTLNPWKDIGHKVKEARKWASRPVLINTENPVPARGSKPGVSSL
jgi:hypothetical protein